VCTHGPYDYDDVVPPRARPGEWPLPAALPEGARHHCSTPEQPGARRGHSPPPILPIHDHHHATRAPCPARKQPWRRPPTTSMHAHGHAPAGTLVNEHPDPPRDGHTPRVASHFRNYEEQFDAGKLGMWLFLSTEILLFSGFFVAYAVFKMLYPEAFKGA